MHLLRGTEYEGPFCRWQDYMKEQRAFQDASAGTSSATPDSSSDASPNASPAPISEDCSEASQTASLKEPHAKRQGRKVQVRKPGAGRKKQEDSVGDIVRLIDNGLVLNGGTDLLLSKASEKSGLAETLAIVFGEQSSAILLSLAFCCVASPHRPLNAAAFWLPFQLLPWPFFKAGDEACRNEISKITAQLSERSVQEFMDRWAGRFPLDRHLSLLLSVSARSGHSMQERHGYGSCDEDAPRAALLLTTDRDSGLPVRLEKVPCLSEGTSAVTEIARTAGQEDGTDAVLGSSYASTDKAGCLQEHPAGFTMGLPSDRFPDILDDMKKAAAAGEFSNGSTFRSCFVPMSVQALTRSVIWNGSQVYLHLFSFSDLCVNRCRPAKAAGTMLPAQESGVFFAIVSGRIQDPQEALYFCQLRYACEKRFADLADREGGCSPDIFSSPDFPLALFTEFLAQILRCWLVNEKRKKDLLWQKLFPGGMSVDDMVRVMDPLRLVSLEGHRPFYKRPAGDQALLMLFFDIDTEESLRRPLLQQLS